MDLRAFEWRRRPGHVLAAMLPPDAKDVPPPLVVEPLERAGVALVWLPLPLLQPGAGAGAAALEALPEDALRLLPGAGASAEAVVEAWLRLYREAPHGIGEAVLQVHDDAAHLADYVAAEEALWEAIYAEHPHKDDPGLVPDCLAEARWLLERVVGAPGFEEQEGFLTQAAFESVARELLVTVRRAEMLNLRHHLRGVATVSGW